MWLNWKGGFAKELARKSALDALSEVAQEIKAASQDEVPLLAGKLRKAAFVRRSRAKTPRVFIGYRSRKGAFAAQAVPWHEGRKVGKQKSPPQFKGGRKKRFLADPFNRIAGPRVPTAYREHFRRNLRGA